jgi:hypothetical protein
MYGCHNSRLVKSFTSGCHVEYLICNPLLDFVLFSGYCSQHFHLVRTFVDLLEESTLEFGVSLILFDYVF